MNNLLLTSSSRPLLSRVPNPNPILTRNPTFLCPPYLSKPLHPSTQTLRLPLRVRRLPPACAVATTPFTSVTSFTTTWSALTTAISSYISPTSLSTTVEMIRPPINAIIAALARWLSLFREVLLIRVLLTWFPNINWDKQPFSALRDLSDPFIALFGDVIPPFMGKLDVRPIIAFQVLEVVISILKVKQIM